MNPEELQRLATDARPRMSWRIGISGHIELDEKVLAELRSSLERIFDDIASALAAVRARKEASQLFALEPPAIALVSPLAEGADRFCAELAVKRGFELRVPLPFAEAEYKRDFPSTVGDFDRLMNIARTGGGIVELDGRGAPADARNRGYMAVGEFVVRNCDLLLAVWNGRDSRGHGGTSDVVAYARTQGVPIVHVLSTDTHPVRLLRAGADEWEAYTTESLKHMIGSQIIPKVRERPKRGKPKPAHDAVEDASLHAAGHYLLSEPLADTGADPDYLYAGPYALRAPRFVRSLSGIFPWFVKRLGTAAPMQPGVSAPEPPCGRNDRHARYLFLHHHRADLLATFYADVHRSAFLLVYALGAIALICAVASLYFHEAKVVKYSFTALELLVLLALGGLVIADYVFRWRDRWLEYRLLAELLREADLLAQIGRPMPMRRIEELAQDLPGRAWVAVAYSAIVRRAGLVSYKFDDHSLVKMRDYAADVRLQDQIAYHSRTESRAESIAKSLRWIGFAAFVATILAALTKLIFLGPPFLGLMAGILPALAYACFGIRNQAEFEIVGRRSERMVAKLDRHYERIKSLKDDKLTSDALGREILQAAAVMRHDAADWASIFEVKETEAG